MKIRYTVPTRLDYGSFGDICSVLPDKDLYVQISQEPDKYNWISIGSFFELAFKKYIKDKDFMSKCMQLALINLNSDTVDQVIQQNSDKIFEEIL